MRQSTIGNTRQSGSALIITIMVLLAVSALGTVMVVTSQGDHLVSANERDAERALLASKSGLNYAYHQYMINAITPTPTGVAFDSFDADVSAALEGAEFTGEISVTPAQQGQLYRILSTGAFGRSTRTTELLFQVIPEAFKYGYMAFSEATLHNHSGLAGPSFRIQSTIFSNGDVDVPNGLTLDGAIVAANNVSIGTGSIVKRDVFANAVSNSGKIEGRATGVCAVSSLPKEAATWARVDSLGNKYAWFNGNSSPGGVGGGTIVGGSSKYTIQNNDEFRFSIFRDDGGLIPDPDLNVVRYIPPPMLDYRAMKAEADLNDPTYFTSMSALTAYFATKKVTEVIDGKTMITVRVGTTDKPEFIYLDDDFQLTLDPAAGADAPNNGLLKAHGFWLEGGIYSSGSFEINEASFHPVKFPAPPAYYSFAINALPYCYPAILAYNEPSTGSIATWVPSQTPAIGGGASVKMSSGSPNGGFVLVNGLSMSQADTHLHHTKSALELIRFNGAELASKIHNCDYFHFSYDPAVRCTRFLVADDGTAEIVSYREVR